jgi:hypothetical protein
MPKRKVHTMKSALKVLSIAAMLSCPNVATAAEYTFSRVYTGAVDPGVAINDNGLVALCNGASLITTDGHTTTIIAGPTAANHLTSTYEDYRALCINDDGYVAFRGYTSNGVDSILASNGITTRTITPLSYVDGDSQHWTVERSAMSINNHGTVAFAATGEYGSGAPYVFTGDGTANATRLNDRSGSRTAINDAGMAAYLHPLGESYTWDIELVRDSQVYTLPGTLDTLYAPDMNALGVVAYPASVNGEPKVVVTDGVSMPTYIDLGAFPVQTGGWWYDMSFTDCAINDEGLVVFMASPSTSPFVGGIFVGSDPVADKVIMGGDTLDGKTINWVSFSRYGLNDRGQIAFMAAFTDGTKGVFVATPVPEPSTVVLFSVAAAGLLACTWRRGNRATNL